MVGSDYRADPAGQLDDKRVALAGSVPVVIEPVDQVAAAQVLTRQPMEPSGTRRTCRISP
jgi:hypothetical protein